MKKRAFIISIGLIIAYVAGLLVWDKIMPTSVADSINVGVAWYYVGFTVLFLAYLAVSRGWRRVGLVGRDRMPAIRWIVVLYVIQVVLLAVFLGLVLSVYDGPNKVMTFILINVIFIAFNEELLFRGFLWDSLSGLRPAPAIMLTSVVFGLVHLINGVTGSAWNGVIVQVVFAAIGGLFDAVVRYGTGSLYPTILTHYLLDTSGSLGADTSMVGIGIAIQVLSIIAAIIATIIIGIRYKDPVQPQAAPQEAAAAA